MKHLVIAISALLIALAASSGGKERISVSVTELGGDAQLVGRLNWPLGRAITVVGVVVEGPFKGYEGGPNLRAQMIHGVAVQEDIQIRLRPYFRDWGEDSDSDEVPPLPKLENGTTYEMEGYETGGYVGIPGEAYEKAGYMLQTTNHYFRTEFIVYRARVVEPFRYHPRHFATARGLLEGAARTRAGSRWMDGESWSVCVGRDGGWPEDIEGLTIETLGMYNNGTDPSGASYHDYDLIDGVWRLVRLEEQLGRMVALRGRAWSLGGDGSLRYRGVTVYVENMARMPGWTTNCSGMPVLIRGRLEKAVLPRLDQLSLKSNRDLQEYFIVRDPTWEPIEKLLGPERPIDDLDL